MEHSRHSTGHHRHHRDEGQIYYDAKGRERHRLFAKRPRHHHHHHHHKRQSLFGIKSYSGQGYRYYGQRLNRDEEKERARLLRRIRVTLIAVLITLASVVALALAAWRILDYVGRRELYTRAEAAAPTLGQTAAALAAEQDAGAEDNAAEEWQDGWVRYNGSVYAYNEDILTFLVMGIDNDYPVAPAADAISGGQADALFLVILNPDTKRIQLLAINRNAMTDIEVYNADGSYDGTYELQICLAHGYGDGMAESCEHEVDAVSNLLYSLPIHGYAAINRGAIPTINNAIGGVTLTALETVPVYALSWWAANYRASELTQGVEYTLDGTQAYWYTKWRNVNEEQSADGRLEREKQYLRQYVKDLKSALVSDPSVALNLYNAITSYMVTNIDVSEITYLAGQIGGYSFDMDAVYSLPGETVAGESGTKTGGHDEFYVDEDELYALMIDLFYEKVR